jgi:DNA (cytosine-5)-methyltransferase 1
MPYSDARKAVYHWVPAGLNWRYFRDDPKFSSEFLRSVMGGALDASGGRVGFWRRLSWDEPSPTLVTSPVQKATGLCHPTEDRPLSVEEYKRVQQFPDEFKLLGNIASQYRQLGNAVPTRLAESIGRALDQLARKPSRKEPVLSRS